MTDTTAPAAAPPRWAEYMPVADLAPALRNAKAHDLQAIAASFDTFGALEPTVLDERTMRLVSGHGRVEFLAAREATGADMPEGVWIDGEGRWCWLVVRGFHSRDDDHAHAAGIALNRTGERGGWVPELLAQDLDSLRTNPELFDATGFTTEYLDDLVASFGPVDDLGELGDRLGNPEPADFWPVLRFKVPPELRARYLALVANVAGGDAEQFAYLVERASR